MMKVNVKAIDGNWDEGYVLDKHVLSSTCHENEDGSVRFDNTRSEAGESLFRLKYRSDWSRVDPIARAIADNIYLRFDRVGLIVPMPATTIRPRQPVTEIARSLGKFVKTPVFERLLTATVDPNAPKLKDLTGKEEREAALKGRFSIDDSIDGDKSWNVVLLDDLFHSGATMEAACSALRSYAKIARIYVAAVSW